MIYEPREDSYLLQKYVEKYSKGNVLDIGTGSGIQAITASKKAKKVIACDINKEAVKQAKISASIEKIKNIEFIESDLFKNIKGNFDLICFNPPYLPEEKNIEDPTLFSAKRGTETTLRFLDQVTDFLKDNGVILLISSSLANQNNIKKAVENNLLELQLLEKIHIFFEDILIYKLTKTAMLKKLHNKKITDCKIFSHGKRGVIIKALYNKKQVSIKIKKKESEALNTIANETRFLKILNKENIGPVLVLHEKDFFMYEFVEGIFIEDFLNKNTKKDILIVLIKIFKQMHKLDELKINKFEMHHPVKHILIKDNNPVLLDFERARYSEDPKNVTQFCDYLTGDDMIELLSNKGIKLKRNFVIKLAKEYKKKHDLNKIIEYISK